MRFDFRSYTNPLIYGKVSQEAEIRADEVAEEGLLLEEFLHSRLPMHLQEVLLEIVQARPLFVGLGTAFGKTFVVFAVPLVDRVDGFQMPVKVVESCESWSLAGAVWERAQVRTLVSSAMFPDCPSVSALWKGRGHPLTLGPTASSRQRHIPALDS